MADRIGKYTVERELGHGGFGAVYLAFDPDVGQPVAIKKLLAQGDPDLLKRFLLEIRTTASLRHKNIVTIHASGEEQGNPYLVMEFLEGLTLKQIIQQRRPLSLLDRVQVMTQVAQGLAYAHSKGVVHRDVKPENIMLLPDGTVKIMDFGIALGPNRNTQVTQTGGIIGTPPYFAPEQLQGLKANEQTDIFSFGDVYYELLTGVHPFEQYKGDWRTLQIAIISYEPQSVAELLPGCPAALENMLHRTLAKDPEFRYQTFTEIQLDSEAILVDLRQEGAAAIVRELAAAPDSVDLQSAMVKINQAYQLDPANREVRRLREELHLRIQREQVQGRVAKLLAEAEQQMREQRYAEAVQTLESGVKLSGSNSQISLLLEDAKGRLANYMRANRLVAEARFKQQKGLLAEADQSLKEALTIDPEHTGAKRLSAAVQEELAKWREDQNRQQVLSAAREHLSGKRYLEALSALDQLASHHDRGGEIESLREAIRREQAEEELRAEKFKQAVAKTAETIEAGEFERAGKMLDLLKERYGTEPNTAHVVRELQDRLTTLLRAAAVSRRKDEVDALLEQEKYPEALTLIEGALQEYPGETGLEGLRQSAQDGYAKRQRAEAIAAALQRAVWRRDADDWEEALEIARRAERDYPDVSAIQNLIAQLESEIDRRNYRTELAQLLRKGREWIAAGRYLEAIEDLAAARKFGGEPEVQTLLESARAVAAAEAERSFAAQALDQANRAQSPGNSEPALNVLEQALARYPANQGLMDAAQLLRERVARENRMAAREGRRAAIRREMERHDWKSAARELSKARADFEEEGAFDDLAAELESGRYEAGWRELEERVNAELASGAVERAGQLFEEPAARQTYSRDRRFAALSDAVAKRRTYENALLAAERHLGGARYAEAEETLRQAIELGAPDQRAQDLRSAVQARRSEARRIERMRAEAASLARQIRERLQANDLDGAAESLAAARADFPDEAEWTPLTAELETRQKARQREREVTARDREIRAELDSALAGARAGGAADSGYPVLESWIAIAAAGKRLAQARVQFPGERAWEELEREISTRRRRAEKQAMEEAERLPGMADWFASEAARGKARFPGEPIWQELEKRVEAHRAQLRREADWNDIERRLRERLDSVNAITLAQDPRHAIERQWEALQQTGNALTDARTRFADDPRLENLTASASSRRESWEHETGAAVRKALRERPEEETVQTLGPQIRNLRAREPNVAVWQELEQAIAGLELQFHIQAQSELLGKQVRGSLRVWDLEQAGSLLAGGKTQFSDQPIWPALEKELVQCQTVITEALDRVSALTAGGNPTEAIQLIERQFPQAPAFAGPLANARRALEEQKQAEKRRLTLAQLAEIERRLQPEPRQKKRRELGRDARRIAAESGDPEAVALASRIAEKVEIVQEPPPARSPQSPPRLPSPAPPQPAVAPRPLPWKSIGIGAGAFVIAGGVAIFWPKTKAPPTPATVLIPIEIRTDPPGALVRLGDHTCTTPNCKLELPPGSYSVDAQRNGYVEKRQMLSVDKSTSLYDLTLEPVPAPRSEVASGELEVETGVADALIYVDGAPRTRTGPAGSATISLDAKIHQLAVERNGYDKPAPQQIDIRAGVSQKAVFHLKIQQAKLEIDGAPQGVQVSIAGAPLGRTDGSANFVFPAAVAPGDRTLNVALGAGQRSVQEHFDPGATARVKWDDIKPAPPAEVKTTPIDPESRDWARIQDSKDVSQVQLFLQTYPNGAHAPQARARLSDLLWGAVDKSNIDAVRQFLRSNPDSPHRNDAQAIVDDADNRAKLDAAKQESAKQDAAKADVAKLGAAKQEQLKQAQPTALAAQDAAARKEILDSLAALNSAMQRNKATEVKKIWPGVSKDFLTAMNSAHTKLAFVAKAEDIQLPAPGQAVVTCQLVTNQAQQKFTVTLQNNGGGWVIVAAHVN